VKTNVDFINPQDEAIYKDKLTKSKEKDKQNNVSMNVVKENIEEENKDEKKINESKKEGMEEDPILSHMNSNRKISKEEIENSNKIILNEIEGNLFEGKTIEINAGGMVGGRGVNDGFTIFGQIQKNGENKEENKFIPDYNLNYMEKYLFYPYIFAIYYKKEEKSYYIRAYSGKGSDNKILFVRLRNGKKLIFKQKELISAGDAIFQITPIDNNLLEIIHLEKQYNNNHINKKIFDGTKNKKITLGRNKECDFSFPRNKSFSRCQATFIYDESIKQWGIIDGNENKGSTNGTWVFGTHSFLIKEEMLVEILNSKILIKEIKTKEDNNTDKNMNT
jgi:hypothetical protein